MTLTVLSDEQIAGILDTLTLTELEEFRQVLSSALHEYSTNTTASPDGPYQQPPQTYTEHPTSRATSIYMPSCGPEGMGCKVVSLTTGEALRDTEVPIVRPTGTMNLFGPDGTPTGLLHARTLTSFRTALASACLLARRNTLRTVTVFGAGSQAYWHVRLALMMRGGTIKNVNIITHSFSDSARATFKRFALVPAEIKAREGWEGAQFSILTPTFKEYDRLLKDYVRASDVIYCCTPSRVDLFDGALLTSHEGRKKGRLIVAVGSLTPDMRELPEALILQATKTHEKGHLHFHKHADEGGVIVVDTLEGASREAGEIVQAGISPNHLVELGELVMLHRMAIREAEETDTIYSQASTATTDSGRLSIDGRSPAMSSVYGSNTERSSRASSPSPSSPTSSFKLPFRNSSPGPSDHKKNKKEDSMARWLRDGTVIFKSVGVGLLDLVVGMHLVKVAKEKGVGTLIEGF